MLIIPLNKRLNPLGAVGVGREQPSGPAH